MLKISKHPNGKLIWVYSDSYLGWKEIFAPFRVKPLVGLLMWKMARMFKLQSKES